MKIHTRTALAGFLLGATFFLLLKEHQAHLLDALPWALLLLCPILHFFMHRGHEGKGSHTSQGSRGTLQGNHRLNQEEGRE